MAKKFLYLFIFPFLSFSISFIDIYFNIKHDIYSSFERIIFIVGTTFSIAAYMAYILLKLALLS